MLVTCLLYWLAIGAVVWALFFSSAIHAQWKLERLALGRVPSFVLVASASGLFIVAWPLPAAVLIGSWMMSRRIWR